MLPLASLPLTPSVCLCRLSPLALTGKKAKVMLASAHPDSIPSHQLPLRPTARLEEEAWLSERRQRGKGSRGLLGKHPNPYFCGNPCEGLGGQSFKEHQANGSQHRSQSQITFPFQIWGFNWTTSLLSDSWPPCLILSTSLRCHVFKPVSTTN